MKTTITTEEGERWDVSQFAHHPWCDGCETAAYAAVAKATAKHATRGSATVEANRRDYDTDHSSYVEKEVTTVFHVTIEVVKEVAYTHCASEVDKYREWAKRSAVDLVTVDDITDVQVEGLLDG